MSDIKVTPRGEAIKMPEALKGKYAFSKPIYGGPVFDFPHVGLFKVNLAELTEQRAAQLVARGWAGIKKLDEKAEKGALEGVVTAKP